MLTSTHKKTIHTVDGVEIHERIGLIEQLRDAVFGGMEQTGGSSLKAKLPVSEAAVDLYQLIDNQISEAWVSEHKRVPGTDRPERLLTEWATIVQDETIVVVTHPEQYMRWDEARKCDMPYVIHAREEYKPDTLVKRWVSLIEDFLDPARTAPIKAPCLQCGASKVGRRKDGEDTVTDALVFRRDRDTGETLDARCLNCGAMWAPNQFEFLIQALGLEDTVVPAADGPSRRVEWSGSDACFDGRHDGCRMLRCRCDCHVKDYPHAPSPARFDPAPVAFPSQAVPGDVCGGCYTIRSVSGACMCVGHAVAG